MPILPLADLAPLPGPFDFPPNVLMIGGAAVALVLAILAYFLFRGMSGSAAPAAEQADLTIDLAKLGAQGPPRGGPQLDVYNIPMRLVVLVIAPLGRGASIPPAGELTTAVDRLAPGMMGILKTHEPVFRRWPAQLSAAGFGPTFFGNIPLPGDQGKDTPWCGIVGRFEYQGQPLAVGMILRSDEPNGLGPIVLERDTQWLDVLRVRREG